MKKANTKTQTIRLRRSLRVRQKLAGTDKRPRMSVVKTNKHLYVQLIDDVKGVTLASANTCAKSFQSEATTLRNKKNARLVGEEIASKAKALGIEQVVFDRGASKFHGIFAELADAARQQGLYC
jgi:large subunit ribosomal protein L18